MKKKMDAFFQKLKDRKPKWLNFQNFIFVIVTLAFVVIIIWSESLSDYFQTRNIQPVDVPPTPTTLFGTPTPLPEEWLTSAQQTNGIISGAVIILIAIVAGTAAILIRDREK